MRDLIVLLVYFVILATIVGQGLLLPFLIRWVGLDDGAHHEAREAAARVKAAKAAIARLEELGGESWVGQDTATRMRGLYEFRIRRFNARLDEEDDGAIETQSQAFQRCVAPCSTPSAWRSAPARHRLHLRRRAAPDRA